MNCGGPGGRPARRLPDADPTPPCGSARRRRTPPRRCTRPPLARVRGPARSCCSASPGRLIRAGGHSRRLPSTLIAAGQRGEAWDQENSRRKGAWHDCRVDAAARALRQPRGPTDRQRRARQMAYLGCAGALGYGGLKVVWALGGTVGLSDPKHFRLAPAGLTAAQRYFDYWGTPILAGLAMVILLGLVYPWGNVMILRPLLRTLAWAGSLLAVVGVDGLILTIRYFAGDLSVDRLGGLEPGSVDRLGGLQPVGGLQPGTFLFVYAPCPVKDLIQPGRRQRLAATGALEHPRTPAWSQPLRAVRIPGGRPRRRRTAPRPALPADGRPCPRPRAAAARRR